MKKSGLTESQIVAILKESEAEDGAAPRRKKNVLPAMQVSNRSARIGLQQAFL